MSHLSKRGLFWAPRFLSIALIISLSVFAINAFAWGTALALTKYLLPSFVLAVALILAWRWEWIGAGLYAAAGLLFSLWVVSTIPLMPHMRLAWALWFAAPALLIAGTAFLIAMLFLANWWKHGELRTDASAAEPLVRRAAAGT